MLNGPSTLLYSELSTTLLTIQNSVLIIPGMTATPSTNFLNFDPTRQPYRSQRPIRKQIAAYRDVTEKFLIIVPLANGDQYRCARSSFAVSNRICKDYLITHSASSSWVDIVPRVIKKIRVGNATNDTLMNWV